MNTRCLLVLACGLWLAVWLPPARSLLESDMALHMAVQIPLLVALGVIVVTAVRRFEPRWLAAADWLGIPGIVAVVLGTSFWMLPRALDQAIADSRVDFIKFVTLPLLVGMPLGSSWLRMPALGRAFIWANFIPKLAVIGGLYLGTPTRLCAYYRLDQQKFAGWTLITVAVALGVTWFIAAFAGWTPGSPKQSSGRSECATEHSTVPAAG